jgi:hypothetical protein
MLLPTSGLRLVTLAGSSWPMALGMTRVPQGWLGVAARTGPALVAQSRMAVRKKAAPGGAAFVVVGRVVRVRTVR